MGAMSVFKACDIRGEYGRELDETLARRLGQAVGTRLSGKTVVVGGDVRLSTPSLKAALIEGLVATGCHVLDLGIVPTPALGFARVRLGAEGSVMVTASHNPAGHNGFKLMLGDRPPSDEQLQAIAAEMEAGAFAEGEGSVRPVEILPEYEASLVRRFAPGGSLRLVVDCGNGCYSGVAVRVLSRLGYAVEGLFCEPDGRFPNRSPNPALPESLRALRGRVTASQADLGLAFDGDGDRVAFVDARGVPAEPDRVAVLFARWLLREGPGEVIYDIKSSSVLPEAVEEAGGRAIMERSGHAFIKTTLLDRGALFGAEISGHYFFRELGGDDALFASCLLLHILQAEGRGLAELLADVPRHPITPDIRLPCPPEKADAILEDLRRAFSDYPVGQLDGTRIDFGDGWALARRSVTEALITLRFEAHSPARLDQIQALVRERVPALAAIWRS